MRAIVFKFLKLQHQLSDGAPADKRSCSWLNPWFFLVSVLAVKIAFVTVCLEESGTCCPKDWKQFQEKCYYLSDDKMSWAESVQNCTGMGSHLVVINSEAEQVCAGLRGDTADSAGPRRGLSAPLLLQGRWDVVSASLQHWLPSATSPTPQGLLPPPSAQSSHLMDIVLFPGIPLQLGKRRIY
ncbi:C-type lectin domain family 10 member A-like [Phalacrocorax carbo]|uniref:C-type lectin domain family 10 member A-like n=1 Tax=Phalacrocorax carbo TaxID=9209 RepID=UPI00311A3B82